MSKRSKFQAPRVVRDFETVQRALREIQESLDASTLSRAQLKVNLQDFALVAGSFHRASVQSASGMKARLPAATGENLSDPIIIHLENMMGDLTVYAAPGQTVNGEATATFSVDGIIIFWSNGVDSWSGIAQVPAESPAGEALDAEYILGSAHASLPNGSVAQSTASVAVSVTPGGFVTWTVDPSALVDGVTIIEDSGTGLLERGPLFGAIESAQGSAGTVFSSAAAGNGLTGGLTSTLNVGAGAYITVSANAVAWTGFDVDNNTTGSPSASWKGIDFLDGNSTQWNLSAPGGSLIGARLDYVGTDSEITLNSISGNQGTVDITGLECGGCVNVVPSADWQIEGFVIATGNPEGFWFFLSCNNSASDGTLFYDDSTATTTNRMRTPNNTDVHGQDIQALIYYANTRWRVVTMNICDEVQSTTSTSLVDFALNSGTTVLRIDSGNNPWTLDSLAGGYHGRRLLVMNASNIASTGTILTGGSAVGTAGNTIITPGNVNRGGTTRYSAWLEYDGTDSTWRLVADNGFSVLANNSLLVNNAGASLPPVETTVSSSQVIGGNFTEGPTSTGLIVHDEVDFFRNLHTPRTPRLAIFEEEFQGNVLGCTDRFAVMNNIVGTSATTFDEDTSSGTTIEYMGAITVGFSHATAGDSSSGFCLGSASREMNSANPSRPFNWQSLRYMGIIVRTTTLGIAARTQIALGMCGPFNSFGGFGTVGLMGGSSEAATFHYDTASTLAREWVCGIRTSSASSSTGSGVQASNGARTLLELVKTASGTLYYYVNGTLVRTDATGALHVSAFCNFYLVSRASTNAVRTISIDWLKIVGMATNNRHD